MRDGCRSLPVGAGSTGGWSLRHLDQKAQSIGRPDRTVGASKGGPAATQARPKNAGRNLMPTMFPAKAATAQSQPCRLPEAMPEK